MENGGGEGRELDRQDGPPEPELLGRAQPAPQTKASLQRWVRYNQGNSTVLEQEIFPMSCTITGNVAVVQYRYEIARETYKKDHETVTGRYTDILIKDGGRWQFIGWAGGEDPKK